MGYVQNRAGYEITGFDTAIDARIYLTKAEMLRESNDDTAEFMMPDKYFCICKDDGKLYLYNVDNSLEGDTGKYRLMKADAKVNDVTFEGTSLVDSEGIAILDTLQGKVKDVMVDSESVLNSEGIANISLKDFSVKDETGKSIKLSCDSEYKLTASLYDVNGILLNSSVVDLPIEQLIVEITYDKATKELVIKLDNGQVVRVPLVDLVNGLAKQSDLDSEANRAKSKENELLALINSEGNRIDAIEDVLPGDKVASIKYVDSEGKAIKAYADKTFVKDVKVNGSSVVTDNVAEITLANSSTAGVVKVNTQNGIGINVSGILYPVKASDAEISGRSSLYKPITPNNLDTAVKAALTDGKGTAYTDTEKAAARTRIGVDLDALQKKLTAGSNITIDSDNKISANIKDYQAGNNINFTGTAANPIINAVDTTYTAGDALKLSGTQFNVLTDNSTIKVDGANKLYCETVDVTAGSGIKIQNGVISTDTDTIPTKTEVEAAYQGKLVAGNNIVISGNTISAVQSGLTYEIVNALPATGDANKVYLVQKTVTPTITYEQWMYISNAWVQLGTTGSVDLSNYYTKGETASLLTSKQDVLNSGSNIKTINGMSVLGNGDLTVTGVDYTAGSNIQINGRVISATDTTYTAGTGIIINGNVISATGGGSGSADWGNIGGTLSNQVDLQTALNAKANTSAIPTNVSQLYNDAGYITSSYHDSTKQNTLIAGANITISGNTISATGGGSGSSTWGSITGDITNQSDLTYQLGLKANDASLATVAKTGNYNDLSNKPTIPTVNNGSLTIQQNGSTIGSFSANSSSTVVANVKTPTFSYDSTSGVLSITDN